MGQIGRFLDKGCTPEMEGRLLTGAMVPWIRYEMDAQGKSFGCLGGVAYGYLENRYSEEWFPAPHWMLAPRFNAFAMRLGGFPRHEYGPLYAGRLGGMYCNPTANLRALRGGARAATLIRNRVLRNQARRALGDTVLPSTLLVQETVPA